MPPSSTATFLLFACVLTAAGPVVADDTLVRVARDGELVRIEAEFIAPVAPAAAWAVLTDFDAMARFVPDLDESKVTLRLGNRLQLEQRGTARWGPFARPYTLLREVELIPTETVRSRGVGGTVRRVRTETRLSVVADGTRVQHRLEFALDVWLPAFLAEVWLRHEVELQFAAIIDEMRRRQQRTTGK